MNMRFVVPDHAKYRIMERGIDVDEAKEVIRKPDSHKVQDDGSHVASKTTVSNRLLTIVYAIKSKTQIIIITGYYEN